MKKVICALVLGIGFAAAVAAAEQKSLEEEQFQEKYRRLKDERDDGEKHRQAGELLRQHRFSSLQVKAIAQSMRDENARLEFAVMAYPRTIDPENFYEVYDAFTTFSKVMRLHDRIRQLDRPAPPVINLPRTISDSEFKDIIKSLRRESFDNTKSQVARQIITSSRGMFLSSQVKQMMDCFDFEPSKLELAKLAYEFTFDRERYFLVNDAFAFDSNKQALARYIESWNRQHLPGVK